MKLKHLDQRQAGILLLLFSLPGKTWNRGL